jgi:hypothetical protein
MIDTSSVRLPQHVLGQARPPPSGLKWEAVFTLVRAAFEGMIMGVSFAAKLRRGSTRTCSAAWSRCAH